MTTTVATNPVAGEHSCSLRQWLQLEQLRSSIATVM
jgi:hypothetical protein